MACSTIDGATGFSRMVSLAQAPTYSSAAKRSGVQSVIGPASRSTSARAFACASGWRCSSQTSQASVLAVVSSPASSIVITLPETSASVIPEPSSAAATSIASRRLAGASRRAGSLARRDRAAAMKPSIAARTATTLRSSSRSAAVFHQRHVGSGASTRRNSAGKILSRWRWMTSSSDSRVFVSAPKASPDTASTVKRMRSACRSIGSRAAAALRQRPSRRALTATSCGK